MFIFPKHWFQSEKWKTSNLEVEGEVKMLLSLKLTLGETIEFFERTENGLDYAIGTVESISIDENSGITYYVREEDSDCGGREVSEDNIIPVEEEDQEAIGDFLEGTSSLSLGAQALLVQKLAERILEGKLHLDEGNVRPLWMYPDGYTCYNCINRIVW